MSTHVILSHSYDQVNEVLEVTFRHPVDLTLDGGGRMATVRRVYRQFPVEMYKQWQDSQDHVVYFFFKFMDNHDEEYPAEEDE